MESPSRFEADSVRDEKVKVLRAIRPMTREDVFTDTIRGQYRKYRDEPNVPPESQTATFGVVKLHVDNWRWQGVPFLLRSGKAMACQTTQIVIQFRPPPHMMFEGGPHVRLHLQPPGDPGAARRRHPVALLHQGARRRHAAAADRLELPLPAGLPGAHARGLSAAAAGRDARRPQPLHPRRRSGAGLGPDRPDPGRLGTRRGWLPLSLYEAGGWGPPSATAWMCRQGREWFDSCPVLG